MNKSDEVPQNQLVASSHSNAKNDEEENDNVAQPTNLDDIDDNSASIDMLGPIVLNKDGTMCRISNWQDMTPGEKETAKRMIAKRNKSRKKALLEAKEEEKKVGDSVSNDDH